MKSVTSRPMLGNAPFFYHQKLILVLLHAKRASFFFHLLQKLRSFTPNCRPAALSPVVSAAKIAFLSKGAEYSTASMLPTLVKKLGCHKRWPSRTGKSQLQVPMVAIDVGRLEEQKLGNVQGGGAVVGKHNALVLSFWGQNLHITATRK